MKALWEHVNVRVELEKEMEMDGRQTGGANSAQTLIPSLLPLPPGPHTLAGRDRRSQPTNPTQPGLAWPASWPAHPSTHSIKGRFGLSVG